MKLIPFLYLICLPFASNSQNHNNLKSTENKTVIKLEDAETIFKEKKPDFWDKYSSGIIAGITVLTSLGISVWQTRNTLHKTKSMSISAARIQWIQELRPNLSELITNASALASIIKDMEPLFSSSEGRGFNSIETKRFEQLNNEYRIINAQLRLSFNKVKLFLNKEEKEHKLLIESIEAFIKDARKRINREHKGEIKQSDLIERAQVVLKNAWEQAKI